MRRVAWAVAMALTLAVGVAAGAWGADSIRKMVEVEYRGITINVDGKPVSSDAEPFILVEKGRTFVPARVVAEALGAKVGWDESSSTVMVYSAGYVTSATHGDWTAWAMPAQGFRFEAPTGLVRQPVPTALLQLAAQDGSLVLAVQKLPLAPDMTAAQVAEASLTEFGKLSGGGMTITDRGTVTVAGQSAAAVTGSYTLAGTPVHIRFVAVPAADCNWGLVILTADAAQEKDQPAVDHFLSTFTLTP